MGARHPWGSKYRVGLLTFSRRPSDEGKVRIRRRRLASGKHVVVACTSEAEANDVFAQKEEHVADNRRRHGYWEPDVQEGALDYGGGRVNDRRDGDD